MSGYNSLSMLSSHFLELISDGNVNLFSIMLILVDLCKISHNKVELCILYQARVVLGGGILIRSGSTNQWVDQGRKKHI